MHITFIGSGNVATHYALALHACGHTIDQVWSRDFDHAELLASRVQAQATNHLAELRQGADVYVMAVTDDALFDIALDVQFGDALVLHTSGATSMQVLRSTSTRYGVVWSPQSFVRDFALDYPTLPFCIEGNCQQAEEMIKTLFGAVSSHLYPTTLEQRRYLHLAAVMVNNFTNGLYATAQQLCAQQQVPFEILLPIIQTTAQKAGYGDVRLQLTGPAVRHDQKTLDAHRKLLADNPQLLDLYDRLTELLQSL